MALSMASLNFKNDFSLTVVGFFFFFFFWMAISKVLRFEAGQDKQNQVAWMRRVLETEWQWTQRRESPSPVCCSRGPKATS